MLWLLIPYQQKIFLPCFHPDSDKKTNSEKCVELKEKYLKDKSTPTKNRFEK
tara:strand:- start:417 stop:572 length:156 start_codon:yes stop_codon:yes gene_type:complete